MKRLILIALLLLTAAAYFFLSYSPITLYFAKTPIDGSDQYYKNPFGTVFIDSTTGCLDICLLSTYSRVKSADAKTFEVIRHNHSATKFAKDKNSVYWDGRIVEGADPNTFKAATYSKGFDAYNSYSTDKTLAADITAEGLGELPVDAKLEIITAFGTLGNVIFNYDGSLYYLNDSANTLFLQQMSAADTDSFLPALDAQGRVQYTYPLTNLDAQFLPGYDGDLPVFAGKDDNFYYVETFGGVIIADTINPDESYNYYGGGYLYYDGKVYYRTSEIEKADPATFVHLGLDRQIPLRFGTYAKDTNNVYFGTEIVKDADPVTFRPVNSYRFKYGEFGFDSTHKFKGGKIINEPPQTDIDRRNLEVFEQAYQDSLNPNQ